MTRNEIEITLATKDYDFLRTNPHLKDKIILLGLGGSHAYGTNTEESDLDIRGIAMNQKDELLLQKDFEQVLDASTDTVIYSFNKIVRLLSEGNPNTLEILFQDKGDLLYLNEAGERLVDNRNLFLSKRCFYSFGGYAHEQLRRLDNKTMRNLSQAQQEEHILHSIQNAEHTFAKKYFQYDTDAIKLYTDVSPRENMDTEIFMDIHLSHYPLRDYKGMWSEMHNIVKDYGKIGKRASNAILHNKVNKHAMHLVRLMLCGIDILKTGTFSTHCGKYLDLLMDIRNGKYSEENGQMSERFFKMVDELSKELEAAYHSSKLPENVDLTRIDELMLSVYDSYL